MNPDVDPYFIDGCGRCPLVATPECKVNTWSDVLRELRSILLECGLDEELKWSMPCYTYKGRNILILSAFKDHCALNIFNGALLQDKNNLLVKPGENTQAGRQMRFTDMRKVLDMESVIKSYIFEAIEVEKAGIKLPEKEKNNLKLPEELIQVLSENPEVKKAFDALTPGRQRGYNLYFSAPKQSKTRTARIEKYLPHILSGKGIHDR